VRQGERGRVLGDEGGRGGAQGRLLANQRHQHVPLDVLLAIWVHCGKVREGLILHQQACQLPQWKRCCVCMSEDVADGQDPLGLLHQPCQCP
jgi:hypothetical protein